MPRLRTFRAVATLVLLPLGMSACLGVGDKHSIIVKSLPENVSYGNVTGDANLNAAQQARVSSLLFPSAPSAPINDNPFGLPFVVPPPSPLKAACPVAGLGVFPLDPASTDILQRPAAAAYAFRLNENIRFNVTGLPGVTLVDLKLPAVGRTIHNVVPVADPANTGAFSFQADEGLSFQALDQKTLSTTFVVRPAGSDSTSAVPVPPTTTPPSPLPNTHQGVAATGVSLTAMSMTYNGTDFRFASPIGVQLIQLPAGNGLVWHSAASDPVNGTSIAFDGGINPTGDPSQNGKARIDACGELVDTWRVDGTLTLSGKSVAIQDKVSLYFVPQYGGWIVADKHQLSNTPPSIFGTLGGGQTAVPADISDSTFDSTLNHLRGGPLPAGTK